MTAARIWAARSPVCAAASTRVSSAWAATKPGSGGLMKKPAISHQPNSRTKGVRTGNAMITQRRGIVFQIAISQKRMVPV